jgi:phosphonate metabolism protein (transferase hexapeptide repeat family)
MPAPVDPNDRYLDPAPRIHPSAHTKGCKLGRYCAIGERTILRDVTVGAFSYFERHAEAIYADIGKFCSIAANTRINALEHPIERVTSHKMSYRPNEFFRHQGIDQGFRAHRSGKRVTIGHDVWIGHGAVVMPGISIGTGAVIGANAVVTHDVPAYMIVAGVPARPLRARFPKAIADGLLALAWWDWDEGRIFDAIADMQQLSAEAFLQKWA